MKKAVSMVSAFISKMIHTEKKENDVKMIFCSALPMAIKTFVMRHFPGRSIAFAEKLTGHDGIMYMTTLNDGIRLGFNANGSWEMVDCQMGAVPASLIPDSVVVFMNAYYPNVPVVKIEKNGTGYKVTLSNFVTLKFDKMENVA